VLERAPQAAKQKRLLLHLCLCINAPISTPPLEAWASRPLGKDLRNILAHVLVSHLSPDDFAMVALVLLSCYPLVNQKQPFVPIHRCQNYLACFERLHNNDNIGANGRLLERIVYSVIKARNSLDLKLLRTPYPRPFQLKSCMERLRQHYA
jgi:hypothetical protein